jgi:hypothetical protein
MSQPAPGYLFSNQVPPMSVFLSYMTSSACLRLCWILYAIMIPEIPQPAVMTFSGRVAAPHQLEFGFSPTELTWIAQKNIWDNIGGRYSIRGSLDSICWSRSRWSFRARTVTGRYCWCSKVRHICSGTAVCGN